MNMDHVQGAVLQAAGKLQMTLGRWLRNPGQRTRGKSRELQGRAQQYMGDAKALVQRVQRRA